jgi:hypothetical protein
MPTVTVTAQYHAEGRHPESRVQQAAEQQTARAMKP